MISSNIPPFWDMNLPADRAGASTHRSDTPSSWNLQKQLIVYPKCPYCDASLIFENCHVDHIYPANRGGLTTPDNMVLICSPCNLSKGSDSLRNFAKRNHLNYNNIVTRLEVMGKHI